MKERTIIIIIVALLIGGITFFILGFIGVIPIGRTLIYLTYILSISIVIVFAMIGAYFFGMITSHKLIRGRTFTPFEKSMLELREDIKKIREEIEEVKKELDKK
jgi:hypothetical protein